MWFCNRGYKPHNKDDLLSNKTYNWQKVATQHFDIYFESGFMPNNYVDSAKTIFERKYSELLKSLEIATYDSRLNLFMIDTRDKMKNIVGMETNGLANVEDNTVFSIFNDNVKTFGIHEFCHIITMNDWGKTDQIWLSEGLAVCSDNAWWSFDLHSLADYLLIKGKLVPVKELIENFYKCQSSISYPQSGSFVKFIKEKYGLDILKNLWKNGTSVFQKSLNKSLSSIEQEWLEEIKKHENSNIDYLDKVSSLIPK